MSRIKLYTVGQLAKRSGVTVRTLHHYDEIGLLVPAMRSGNGRRLYDRDSVLRLQQILIHRTLGLPLDEIARILDDPGFDRRAALLAQRHAITEQITRHEALVRGIDEALALIDNATQKDMDMSELFGGFDPSLYEDEAKARWGNTDAWKESTRRTAQYGAEDLARYHREHRDICQKFADLAAAGISPEAKPATEAAKDYTALIDRWFYPCDTSQLAQLADMYEADARFRKNFDDFREGTSDFVIQAFRICAREAM